MKLMLAVLLWSQAAQAQTRPALAYSQIFGGNGADYATAIAVDSAGNSYVAGQTSSTDFPIVNGLQKHIGGTPLRASADNGRTWTAPAIGGGVWSLAGTTSLYAGTSTQIYRSSDSGKTWTALPGFPTNLVNALVVTAAAVYAGTGSGVFQSQDSGATWHSANQGFGPYLDVATLAAHPARPATLIASVYASTPAPSLYRSVDSGATWVPLPNAPGGVFTSLVFDSANPDILYGAANPGLAYLTDSPAVFKSTDSGDTWSRIADGPASLAVGPAAVFLAGRGGVARSTDGGATWSPTGLTAGADAVAVDPANPQRVYADAGGIFASADGGLTWKSVLAVRQVVRAMLVAAGSVYVGATPGQNVFVTKWSADGKQMLYSTYLGGSLYDYATGIAVDRAGNAYVTGYTSSSDFPVTAGALQGDTSGFAAKIAPDGSTLQYSTYLPGIAFGIAIDGSGAAYVTGYRTCVPPISTTANPGTAFVAKLAPDGGSLSYSTDVGTSCGSEGFGIAVDSAGNAYVTGAASKQDGTSGNTGFLAKLNSAGAVIYTKPLGGEGNDVALGVTLDGQGNIYVTGSSFGFDNSDPVCNGGGSIASSGLFASGGAAYVLKLDPSAANRIYLKYLGGCFGNGRSIAVDFSGRAWVAGLTAGSIAGTPFPTVHPFQALQFGQGFLSELSADGATLLFSSMVDSANSMALDSSGNAYVAGFANTSTSPYFSKASAELVRVNGAVPAAVTVEAPQRIGGPASGVAPGEIVTLTGTGLGPAQAVDAQLTAAGTVATSLGGTTVIFNGTPAPLLSVQAQQIVCIVPFDVNYPGATMQVTSTSGTSNTIRMANLVSAVEVLAVVNQDGSVNSGDHPAAPGSIVTLYAAGLGQTTPPSVDGSINGTAMRRLLIGPVGVRITDQDAAIVYAGPAPGQVAGVTQINFTVPPQLIPSQYSAYVSGFNGDYGTATVFVSGN